MHRFICIVYYFDMTPTNNVSTVRKRVDRVRASPPLLALLMKSSS